MLQQQFLPIMQNAWQWMIKFDKLVFLVEHRDDWFAVLNKALHLILRQCWQVIKSVLKVHWVPLLKSSSDWDLVIVMLRRFQAHIQTQQQSLPNLHYAWICKPMPKWQILSLQDQILQRKLPMSLRHHC